MKACFAFFFWPDKNPDITQTVDTFRSKTNVQFSHEAFDLDRNFSNKILKIFASFGFYFCFIFEIACPVSCSASAPACGQLSSWYMARRPGHADLEMFLWGFCQSTFSVTKNGISLKLR